MTIKKKDSSKDGLPTTVTRWDMVLPLKKLISEAANNCGKSRFQICLEMSELTGVHITVARFNNWTSEAHTDHFPPVHLIAAFCKVTCNTDILKHISEPLDTFIVDTFSNSALEILAAREAFKNKGQWLIELCERTIKEFKDAEPTNPYTQPKPEPEPTYQRHYPQQEVAQ